MTLSSKVYCCLWVKVSVGFKYRCHFVSPASHTTMVSLKNAKGRTMPQTCQMQPNKSEFTLLEKFHLALLYQCLVASLLYEYSWAINSEHSALWNGNWNLSREQPGVLLWGRPSLKHKVQTPLSITKEPRLLCTGMSKLSWTGRHSPEVSTLLSVVNTRGGIRGWRIESNPIRICPPEVHLQVKMINTTYTVLKRHNQVSHYIVSALVWKIIQRKKRSSW